ncbi:hypothetical protein Zmor_018309 [Zophobas morio]|uniref:Uncharacterized protein n=1 Tax=Zophobas morio TaxID=2755281 RepID=A0AA38IE62_9CUCU|nr:hypothetical protein Zmor_018309 [Zophobas morio]
MFFELLNHGIWPNIFAYKRLQNTLTLCLRSPIVITRHNNESALFNEINHFQPSLPRAYLKSEVHRVGGMKRENGRRIWTSQWRTISVVIGVCTLHVFVFDAADSVKVVFMRTE